MYLNTFEHVVALANMFVNRQEEDVWSFEKEILQTKFKNEEPKQSEIKQKSQCAKN